MFRRLILSLPLVLAASCTPEEEHDDVCDACAEGEDHDACHEASEACEELEESEHEGCQDDAAALCE